MDDAGKNIGVLDVEVNLTIDRDSRGHNTISWINATGQDNAEDNLTIRLTSFLTITALLATAVYDPGAVNGIEIGQGTIYNQAVELGDYIIYATRDSNNQFGIWALYDGRGGSGTDTFTISTSVTVVFQHNDQGAVPPGANIVADQITSGGANALIGDAGLSINITPSDNKKRVLLELIGGYDCIRVGWQ